MLDQLQETQGKNPDLRLDIARALAQLSKAENDAVKKAELTARAVAAIKQAVEDGLRDPFAVTSEVNLSPLAAMQAFKKLSKDWASGVLDKR